MLKNNLRIAIRNILKHKGFSFINITGLAIGIACSILIFLFAKYELSYDSFYKKADRTYRIAVRALLGDTKIRQTYSSALTFTKLLEDFPEIETGLKFLKLDRVPVKVNERTFYEEKVFAVDSVFYDVFTIPLIHGNPKTVLTQPNSIVLSKNTALKYFGKTDVVGEILRVNSLNRDYTDYKITGVSENVPDNSHFHYHLLVSSTSFPSYINSTGWSNNNFISYIVLKKGSSKEDLQKKLAAFTKKYMPIDRYDEWIAQGNYWEYFLQPLRDIHLNSDLNGEFEANGNKTYVYMFLVISVIILLIACINFMNLSTAKSSLRAKEVGLRKMVGSQRSKLIWQFLNESILFSFISFGIGIGLVEILLPFYRNLLGRQIEIHYFDNPIVIPALLFLGIFVGVVSGSYPAFVLSSFKPITVLKSRFTESKGGLWTRNVLIILQFSISIFLIICTLVVYKQLKLFKNVKLGFEKEQVLVINNPGILGDKVATFKDVLRSQAGINDVSGSNTLPGQSFSNIGFRAEGVDKNFTLNLCVCDYDFNRTLQLKLLQGRFFSRDFQTDSTAVVINQKTAELLGYEDPIGKKINNWDSNFTVIGVVQDYHYESLHHEIRPMALFLSGGHYKNTEKNISVRLNTENISRTIKTIENTWNQFAFNMPFEYSFLDQDFDNLYINEKQTRKLFTIFSFLAVFIACLGLFGLASFIAERKTREIGIRKVLGASIPGLVGRLGINFTKWVLLANFIAWPAAWFAMNKWLQNFAYQINIGIAVFLFAGLLSLGIAIITVSYQAIKAATANPVKALKYE